MMFSKTEQNFGGSWSALANSQAVRRVAVLIARRMTAGRFQMAVLSRPISEQRLAVGDKVDLQIDPADLILVE